MKDGAVICKGITPGTKRTLYFVKTGLTDNRGNNGYNGSNGFHDNHGNSCNHEKPTDSFDKRFIHAIMKSPSTCYTALFIGVPILILAAVSVVSFAVILPIGLIFGWI